MPENIIDVDEWDDDPQRSRNCRERWTELVLAEHTTEAWASIVAAVRVADSRVGDAQRGNETWCRLALSAAAHPANGSPTPPAGSGVPQRFRVDQDLVRVWLGAPAPVQLDPNATVADRLGLVDWWQASDIDTHKAATTLLTNAQLSGIVALSGHHIVILRIVDGFADDSRYLLALLRDTGPTLLCDDRDAGHLIPHTARTRVDGAVHLLTAAASIANDALDQLEHPAPPPPFPGRHAAAEQVAGGGTQPRRGTAAPAAWLRQADVDA